MYTTRRARFAIALLLIVTGLTGLYGSFQLVLDEFIKYEHPTKALTCDVSVFLSCSNVMTSWQGHLLGFPNPLLGMMGFVAPAAVGVAMLAGFRSTKWFSTLFNAGLFAAWLLVTWLFTQALWSIGYLCLWCMLVWSVTIPLFWVSSIWHTATGVYGRRAARIGQTLLPYSWAFVLTNYAVIIVSILAVFPTVLAAL